ncbi:MAG: GTP-binding protein [Candidatus Lokiarchaeota archaeon]|nr:GTP-binding protein [Candidatus Lokiarchaeota archaeon]
MEPYKKWKKKRHLRTIPEATDINTFASTFLVEKKVVEPQTKDIVKTGYDNTFKIIVFGNSEVGKRTFLKQYTKEVISRSKADKEGGVEFHTKSVILGNNRYLLQIWSFKDMDRFHIFYSTYSKGAHAGLFFFDISNLYSLANYEVLISLIRKVVENPESFPILMIGNKLDLEKNRQVQSQQAIRIAKSMDINGYIECSAMTGENVEEIFINIVKKIVEISRSIAQ